MSDEAVTWTARDEEEYYREQKVYRKNIRFRWRDRIRRANLRRRKRGINKNEKN